MRTTVEIPDDLFKQAKRKALEKNTTLKDFIIKALRHELVPGSGLKDSSLRISSPLVKVSGDCPLLRLSPEELGRIDAESDESI